MLHIGDLSKHDHGMITWGEELRKDVFRIFHNRIRFCCDCLKIAPIGTDQLKPPKYGSYYKERFFHWMVSHKLFDTQFLVNNGHGMICLCCFAKRLPNHTFRPSDFPTKFEINKSLKRRKELAAYANRRINDNPNW